MKYMVILHNVPHEIFIYLEELKVYGEIVHHKEKYPTIVYIESLWDKEIIASVFGVKEVREPLYAVRGTDSVLREIMERRGLR
ncbi:hypothetical protein D3C71_901050 [compost metagenome]